MFPVVFEEAATVARRLGIQYLWIDTICIIQDDKQDWETEAAKMADIFEDATITIAASSSPDPTVSFLGLRPLSFRDIQLNHEFRDENQTVLFKARRRISLGMHAKSHQTTGVDPLDSRAWGLQEKELSTRLISFTGAEIQWKCQQQLLCECQNTSFPLKNIFRSHPTPLDGNRNDECFKEWHKIVQKYTSRNLTLIADRIPALAGLATKFSAVAGATYMAGLWKENLLQDLSWQRDARTPLEIVPRYLGPSYSWVSIAGSSDYALARDAYPGTMVQHSSITNSHCETIGSGASGLVTGGSLTVRGPTITARLCSADFENGQSYTLQIGDMFFTPGTFQRGTCEFSVDTILEHSPTEHNTMEQTEEPTLQRAIGMCNSTIVNGVVKLFSLYTISHPEYVYGNFLMLGKSRTQKDAYERIGVGTGKIYRKDGCTDRVSEHTGPFEWLGAAFGSMRAQVDAALIEDMVIS
ncbi:hypothetical protein CI238_12546 [Colletotrichum incanum]|uniref:Heterokaryon incompatibility domain-containing protein n=1 Tax=Colletotrichum incanum TaxID=1573173 RepID=A0A167D2G8_COLIC|nr:hypothetical protein CI238_12546 [Colletotrichum incanum]